MPEGAILVARTAAPEAAALLDRAAGLVTDIGGVASHLASVARELGLPALFDAGDATSRIPTARP
jgi:pyruvate,water dikinase